MDITLKAEQRDKNLNPRQLRKKGQIPCSIYAKSMDDLQLQITEFEIKRCMKSHAKMVTLNCAGKTYHASIQEIQTKPGSNEILHVAFHAFQENEKIHITVPVHLFGKSLGQDVGGVLQQQLNEVELYGYAKDLPDEFMVDVSKLEIGHSFHLSDLPKQGKYEIKDSGDKVVVACNYPKIQAVDEPVVEEIIEAPAAEIKTEETVAANSKEKQAA